MFLLLTTIAPEEREAFEKFYRRMCRIVYAAAQRELNDPAAAEDVTQNVFETLLQRCGGKPRALQQISPGWLVTMARWRARDLRRQERKYLYCDEDQWELVLEERACPPAAVEERLTLQELLRRLKPAYRDLLELRLVLGLSNKEAAAQLGLSENSASVRYRRALETLQRMYLEQGGAER